MRRFTSFFSSWVHKFDDIAFASPKIVLGLLLFITLFFASKIPGVRMYSDFAELLPQEHTYIQLHNEIRDSFGGANNIIVAVEVENGDIFTNETIQLVNRLTQKVDRLPGVNHNMVASLTHRTVRKVWLTETGDVNSAPYYDALKEQWTEDELTKMREDVKSNPPSRKSLMLMILVRVKNWHGTLVFHYTLVIRAVLNPFTGNTVI